MDGLSRRLERNIIPVTESGCWIWTAGTVAGYGRMKVNGRPVLIHRLMYERAGKHIPEGYTVDHLCRVRCCVNPDHLEAVTFKENVLRGIGPTAVNRRKAKCNNGHEFNDTNTHITKTGGRVCRVCDREEYWDTRNTVLADRKSYYERNREAVKARARAYRARKKSENAQSHI